MRRHFFARYFSRLTAWRHPRKFEIYTDGSLKKGIGAWAFVVLENNRVVHEAWGRVKRTDSNRMEFQAALEALRWLPASSDVVLYSDSRILVETLTHWRHVWKKAGWTRERQRTIHNLDYIQALDTLSERHSVTWKWVRAHAGIRHNERCDHLCIEART